MQQESVTAGWLKEEFLLVRAAIREVGLNGREAEDGGPAGIYNFGTCTVHNVETGLNNGKSQQA